MTPWLQKITIKNIKSIKKKKLCPIKKEQENQEKSSNKQGFGEKSLGLLKKSVYTLAAVHLAIGSFTPVVRAVIGGITGPIASRATAEHPQA